MNSIYSLSFDEFGAPDCTWKEARSSSKKLYLSILYFVLVVDAITLAATLLNPPYSTFDIVQIVLESLVLIILLPKVIGRKKGVRNLSIQDGILKIQSGIVYRKNIALTELDKVSLSKKQYGNRKLVLHYPNGKKEVTRFQMSLPYLEDRKRMVKWLMDVNEAIKRSKIEL